VGELTRGDIALGIFEWGGLSEAPVIVRTRLKPNAWVGCEIIRLPNVGKLRITLPQVLRVQKSELMEAPINPNWRCYVD